FGDAVDLHACDYVAAEDFPVFRAAARPRYLRLDHPIRLPYEDFTFDAVIGSGVLEHTTMDRESLKEVHRVLRPDGVFVITYLPYRYSWDEWYLRRVVKAGYHRRLYGKAELARLLLSYGFQPEH